jgi:nitrogen fixation/metabolism regulation signal transduction histidine kinase
MKEIIICLQPFFSFYILLAQSNAAETPLINFTARDMDSLKKSLSTDIDDSMRLQNLFQIVVFYIYNNLDSSMKYVKQFQRFFTTKPTGQGTRLGLSLSYDIIRAHGGEIKVETREGEGSVFVVQLPLNLVH